MNQLIQVNGRNQLLELPSLLHRVHTGRKLGLELEMGMEPSYSSVGLSVLIAGLNTCSLFFPHNFINDIWPTMHLAYSLLGLPHKAYFGFVKKVVQHSAMCMYCSLLKKSPVDGD